MEKYICNACGEKFSGGEKKKCPNCGNLDIAKELFFSFCIKYPDTMDTEGKKKEGKRVVKSISKIPLELDKLLDKEIEIGIPFIPKEIVKVGVDRFFLSGDEPGFPRIISQTDDGLKIELSKSLVNSIYINDGLAEVRDGAIEIKDGDHLKIGPIEFSMEKI